MIDLDSPLASTPEEINGVFREIGGITFRIRPLGESNRQAMAVFARLRTDNESLQSAVFQNLPEVLQSLVVGWDGMVDISGQVIHYTPETALELFEEHGRLAKAIFLVASELGNDDDDDLEEDEKNS